MLELLKQKEQKPEDVKSIRHELLVLIKDQLRKAEGGEGGGIRGLQLFLAPTPEEKHLYEAAVYFEEKEKFAEEVQKIADDFAIDLPPNWTLETSFVEVIPAETIRSANLPLALHISTRKQPALNKPTTACIKVLGGEAEQKEYTIHSASGRICIGREKSGHTSKGFYRENTISFPASANNSSNKFISREHAHIEWNKESGCFFLFADEGGIPPRNKIKVRPLNGELIKLQTTQIGHLLQNGDQIILGESALLEFNYVEDQC